MVAAIETKVEPLREPLIEEQHVEAAGAAQAGAGEAGAVLPGEPIAAWQRPEDAPVAAPAPREEPAAEEAPPQQERQQRLSTDDMAGRPGA